MVSDDPYSRVDYRRLIAWPARIEREGPWLLEVLGGGPGRRVLDLGCGTGEHARFLASRGFEVVGVDASPSMLEKATSEPVPPNLRFVEGDLAAVGDLVEGIFDGAICLGNTLPHLRERDALARAFAGLRARLAEGAPFLFQILNYEKIFTAGQRHLPLNFRPGGEGSEAEAGRDEQLVFLRLMLPRRDGTVLFNPTTLRWRPGAEPPLEVMASKNVLLRGWRRGELEELLDATGFRRREFFGGMERQPYEPLESSDLVVVAR